MAWRFEASKLSLKLISFKNHFRTAFLLLRILIDKFQLFLKPIFCVFEEKNPTWASGLAPAFFAASPLVRTTEAAPSFKVDAFPAVTVPSENNYLQRCFFSLELIKLVVSMKLYKNILATRKAIFTLKKINSKEIDLFNDFSKWKVVFLSSNFSARENLQLSKIFLPFWKTALSCLSLSKLTFVNSSSTANCVSPFLDLTVTGTTSFSIIPSWNLSTLFFPKF